jgi:hypothetical protein
LEQTYQYETAEHIHSLSIESVLVKRFVKIVPLLSIGVPVSVEMMAEDLSE